MRHIYSKYIWVRSRNRGRPATRLCHQLIANPSNKTAAVAWPDPHIQNKCGTNDISFPIWRFHFKKRTVSLLTERFLWKQNWNIWILYQIMHVPFAPILPKQSNSCLFIVGLFNKPNTMWTMPWSRHQMETFPQYWPFVRGIHRSPLNSPAQKPVTRSFDVFFDLRLNKRFS